jgi:hypothetical protein
MKKTCHIACLFLYLGYFAQNTNPFHSKNRFLRFNPDTDFIFNRSRIIPQALAGAEPELKIGCYVSSYFAINDDDNLPNGFVQFPTLEPRKDQFSLNMALISLAYASSKMRGNITLHYGDVPESSWPATFNLIQEANGGFKLFKDLWLDAGFFKTHIGIESFQPRENIASSMSIMNYYDPYFLSGVKLTYSMGPKLRLMGGVFNGYNEYLDNNRNKAFGFTAIYNASDKLTFTYNALTCDESPDAAPAKHQRLYHNFYSTLHLQKLIVGVDINYGMQQHSLKSDTARSGQVYGALAVAKYQFIPLLGGYARVETFSDPDRILTGNLDIGDYIHGFTAGIEFTPQKTISINAEWRILEADHLIFRQGNKLVNQRNEFNLCLDLWF